MHRQRAEAQADRHGYALAEDHRLAGRQGRHEGEQVGGGVRHRRPQQGLIPVVGHAHGEERPALGDDGRVDFGRALRDESERHAVFASLAGDAAERSASRVEAGRCVGRGVAVRLFADEEDRHGALAPKAEVEGKAAEHADHGIHGLGRQARHLHDVDRLAVRIQPEQGGQDLAHRVAADVGVLEHEGVVRIVADGLDPRHQPVIVHASTAVLQPAHALVDLCHEILDRVGDGRVDAVGGAAGDLALAPQVSIHALVLRIHRLRDRDHVCEDLDFLGDGGPAAIDHIRQLFEVEQPERQLDGAGVDDVGTRAETASVFVVAVEQEHAEVRTLRHDRVEDDRHAARLAHAGGAEEREMLAHQPVDVDAGGKGLVLVQGAHGCETGLVGGVDEPEVGRVQWNRLVADRRIFGDAALESAGAVAALANLAHEIHRHRGQEALGSGPGGKFGRSLGHHGDDEGASGLDADEAADRGGEPGSGGIGSDDAEPRLCARDGDHLAERRVQCGFVDQAGMEVMRHRFGRRRRRSLPSE